METVSEKENRRELFWEVAKKEQKGRGGRRDTRKWRNGLRDNMYCCNIVPPGNAVSSKYPAVRLEKGIMKEYK